MHNLLIACSIDTISLFGCKSPEQETQVDEIKLLVPGPFLGYIVDLEYTIWWHPKCWRWVQIDTIHRCLKAVSCVTLHHETNPDLMGIYLQLRYNRSV